MIWVLWAGCSDYQLELTTDVDGGGDPRIEVQPTALDFWSVPSSQTRELIFDVRNVGEADLDLTELILDDGPFTIVDAPELSAVFAPGEYVTLTVTYAPTTSGEQTGEILVRSTDPSDPEVPVALVGTGLAPWLVIDPEEHDFGTLPAGCASDVDLTLQNQGDEDLEVMSLSVEGVALETELELPLALAPGAWTTVTLGWVAAEGMTTGSLITLSNDPRGEVGATTVGLGTAPEATSETFIVDADVPVDIALAVDQSCSMDDDAERLGDGFEVFVEELERYTRGWRLGVVTYDHGCFNDEVFTRDTSDVAVRFSVAVQLGEDEEISDDEALLQLATRALALDASGACNEGFLREDASLQVLVVSDEPERSTEEIASWDWEHWLEALLEFVAVEDQLTVSGVVDLDGCEGGADGYTQIISATGGEERSICSDDWDAHLAALAQAAVTALHAFELAAEPVVGSVSVWVEGMELLEGWSVDGAVVLVDGDVVVAGDEVEVRYEVAEDCP